MFISVICSYCRVGFNLLTDCTCSITYGPWRDGFGMLPCFGEVTTIHPPPAQGFRNPADLGQAKNNRDKSPKYDSERRLCRWYDAVNSGGKPEGKMPTDPEIAS